MNHRWGKENWGLNKERSVTSVNYWKQPLKWNKKAGELGVRLKVFCASMADVWEDRPELQEVRNELFYLILETPNLDWLILTKRPQNIHRMIQQTIACTVKRGMPEEPGSNIVSVFESRELPRNVWLGCSIVNDQEIQTVYPEFKKAVEVLNPTIAFVSAEPLLGSLAYLNDMISPRHAPSIDWMIVGAESGHHARPMHPSWVENIVKECRSYDVPVFVKQFCDNGKKIPFHLFPEDSQVREFPTFDYGACKFCGDDLPEAREYKCCDKPACMGAAQREECG